MSDSEEDNPDYYSVNAGGLGIAEIKAARAEVDAKIKSKPKEGKVNEARIPDLMKIGEIPSEYGQTLTTDIIDPVTFNQNRCRFTLQRVSGFLHSNSKITLAVTPLTTASAFYPVNIGVANLIRTATLTIGNQVVCSVDDFASFHTYQSLFLTNENNKEREQYLSQRLMNHAMIPQCRAVADITDIPVNSAATYGLSNGRNPVVNTGTGAGAFELLPFQQHDGTSAQAITEAPVYSIYLSDLFPFLRFNQLPAWLVSDEIHIDLTFTDETSSLSGGVESLRMCKSETGADNGVEYLINQDEVKLIYDSISYDGEVMRKYADQNKSLSFNYVDYRLAKRTGDETAFPNLTFPVGGNGRLVSKVLFGIQDNDNYVAESLLNGQALSSAPTAGSDLSVNIRYNDRFEFNVDRSNNALLFHTTHQAEGQVPMVSRQEWGREMAATLTTDTFEGHNQSASADGLGGNFNWVSVRPNRGERINNKGIDLVYKNTLAASTYTLRCWLELLKVATIEDGRFKCYFA